MDKVNAEADPSEGIWGCVLVAIAQSLKVDAAPVAMGGISSDRQMASLPSLYELSDADLIEMWLNAANPDQPTAIEGAVRDELSRRDIGV